MMHKFTYHGELYSSKNSRQIFKNRKTGKSFVSKSKVSKTQEVDFAVQLADFKNRLTWDNPKNFPLKISFKIYRKTHGRFDYVNIVQGLLDAMTKAGYIPDDDANHVIPSFEPYEKDKDNPRVEVFVKK